MTALIARDLALAWRAGGGALTGLLFFLGTVALVPFAVGPDLPLIERIGPAIVWLGALLASLLGLDRIVALDREDGSLDLLRTAPQPLETLLLAKIIAHWLATGLPLVLAALPLGLLANQGPEALLATAFTLLVGTPALAAWGAMGASIAAALPRGGLLIAVVVLPLCVPTLIFGTAAASAMAGGRDETLGAVLGNAAVPLALLGALSLLALAVSPFAMAAALRGEE